MVVAVSYTHLNELKRHNSMLADAAHDAGVVEQRDYAIFQNYGYKGPVSYTHLLQGSCLKANITVLLQLRMKKLPTR